MLWILYKWPVSFWDWMNAGEHIPPRDGTKEITKAELVHDRAEWCGKMRSVPIVAAGLSCLVSNRYS